MSASRRTEAALLATPAAVVLGAFFLLPIAMVLAFGFFRTGIPTPAGFDASSWARLFADDYYLGLAARTLRLGLVVTLVTLLVGYPLAIAIDAAPKRWRAWLVLALVLPLMTSVVVRSFGWLVILGRTGPVIQWLREFGLVDRRFQLAHTETGVAIAMVQVLLPYMVLTLLGVIGQIDRRLLEAARAMGASWWMALARVTLPLSRPGVVAGSVLVFAVTVGSFITPVLIGGLKLPVLASGIYASAISENDWSMAAVQSIALFAVVLAVLLPYTLATRSARGRVHR